MSVLLAGSTSSRQIQPEIVEEEATGVLVYAKDPISRAGVSSQLAGWRGIDILDPREGHPADVAVVVAETVDEEVIRVIRTIRRGNRSQVVLVVTELGPNALPAALEAGALGVLGRSDANGEHLASVVGQARRGQRVVPANTAVAPAPPVPASKEAGPAHRLSSRDIEVLQLLADGCDTTEIARRLAYSEPTIKNVIQRLFDQLKVRNRPHAVAVAMRAGII